MRNKHKVFFVNKEKGAGKALSEHYSAKGKSIYLIPFIYRAKEGSNLRRIWGEKS